MTAPPATDTAADSATSLRTIVDANGGVQHGVSRQDVETCLSAGEFFWLDLPHVGDEELGWMRELFDFHPLSIEDSAQFHQRPKLEEYDDYVFLVLYGSGVVDATWNTMDSAPKCSPEEIERVAEVHAFVSAKYLVTVHRDNCPSFAALASRIRGRRNVGDRPGELFYRVADTLVDSFFPLLSELDDRIDLLQAQVIEKPTNDQLSELLNYRSSLITLRRVITPMRDMFASLSTGVADLPGFDEEAGRYFRDIYDHLIRLSDLVDSYRDLLSGTTDAYLSVVSNQLNQVMKQLTIIATVFLPLSFLTGFYGQNYGWMVNHLGSFWTFLFLGIGSELAAVAGLFTLFKKRGWL